MRTNIGIHRAVSKMVVDSHRQIHSRAHQADYYGMAERLHQFQLPVSGSVGVQPIENSVEILFDIAFLYEYGNRRDSQLLEPQTHVGFSSVSASPGTHLYAHVQSWLQDQDLNYIGASMTVGAYNPSIALVGFEPITSLVFSATLHASFQGYGSPIDPSMDLSDT